MANSKHQTSDSSWEFFKIENEQIKTAQDNSYGSKIAWNYQLFMYRNNEQYTISTCGTNPCLPFDINMMLNLSNKIIFNYAIALPCSIISTRFRKCGKIAQPIRIAICWTILMPVWRACHDFLLRHTAFKNGSREGIPRADATTAKAL